MTMLDAPAVAFAGAPVLPGHNELATLKSPPKSSDPVTFDGSNKDALELVSGKGACIRALSISHGCIIITPLSFEAGV